MPTLENLQRLFLHIYRGTLLDLSFNHRYLSAALALTSAESISLIAAGIGRPLIIKGVGDTCPSVSRLPNESIKVRSGSSRGRREWYGKHYATREEIWMTGIPRRNAVFPIRKLRVLCGVGGRKSLRIIFIGPVQQAVRDDVSAPRPAHTNFLQHRRDGGQDGTWFAKSTSSDILRAHSTIASCHIGAAIKPATDFTIGELSLLPTQTPRTIDGV